MQKRIGNAKWLLKYSDKSLEDVSLACDFYDTCYFNKQFKAIEGITPFKFRKSFYFEDENVRDMIFKGYTLPYLVDIEKDTLVLLDIFKWKSREILE